MIHFIVFLGIFRNATKENKKLIGCHNFILYIYSPNLFTLRSDKLSFDFDSVCAKPLNFTTK